MDRCELFDAIRVTGGQTAVVLSLSELKTQCRVDHPDEDSYIEDLGREATEHVERDTRLLLRPTTLRLTMDRFPIGRPISIERFPVTAVTEITYVDANGDDQVWPAEQYVAGFDSCPARIVPAFGQSYPVTRLQPGAVRITFTGGFASKAAAGFPLLACSAIKTLVGTWYERPESRGSVPEEINAAYMRLINRIAMGAL